MNAHLSSIFNIRDFVLNSFELSRLREESSYTEKQKLLIGSSALRSAQIDGWISISQTFTNASKAELESFNHYLSTRSYLCGSNLTLADISMYFAIEKAKFSCENLTFVVRWAVHCKNSIEKICSGSENLPELTFPAELPKRELISFPLLKMSCENVENSNDKKAEANKKAEPNKTAEPKGKKAEPKDKKPAKTSEKTKPKEKNERSCLDEEGELPDPTKLDIRVGKIQKVWHHPEAEKLFCEEIDIGEDRPRNIASGLRLFYQTKDLEERRVLVLANLKPRALVGFKSEGMVLCASNQSHTEVRFVDPPKDAPIGSRVTFPGREGEPAPPSQIQKKKILEKVLPFLKTDSEGIPSFDGCPFTVEGFGNCTTSLPNASVS